MEAKYATLLCERGGVRYGTLYDFRKQELHSHGVLDLEEGLIHYTEYVVQATSDQLGTPLKKFFGENNVTQLVNCGFEDIVCTEPDQWVYCFSMNESWDADIDPRYTACIEIFDPKRFIMALTDHIAGIGAVETFFNHGRVDYRDRAFSVANNGGEFSGYVPERLGMIKPKSFAQQDEYRVLFVPKHQGKFTLKPFCARIPELTQYCRRISLRS